MAITTRYHGPTNTRGARITASTESGARVSIPYPYEAPREDRYRAAAAALCAKMGWAGTLIAGSIKRGYVYVFADDD